jgi:hypothetical protein
MRFAVVAYATPDRIVDRHRLNFVGREESDPPGLRAPGESAAGEAASKADRELLPNLAIGVFDDVSRIGVDPDQTLDLDVEAVSSLTSRMAVWAIVSPTSIPPPGIVQRPLSVRSMRRIAPAWLGTTADAAGTRLFATGAFGSLKCSIRAIGPRGRPDGLEVLGEVREDAIRAEPADVQERRAVTGCSVEVRRHEHVVVESERSSCTSALRGGGSRSPHSHEADQGIAEPFGYGQVVPRPSNSCPTTAYAAP